MERVKILIVDDRPQNLTALAGVLADDDYETVSASSGHEALRCLLKQEFAVVLLDVMMPGMDGFEVASLLRQRERSRYTPIIFMSATGNDGAYSMRSYEMGAVDYLIKPSAPEVVRAKVAVFAELFRKNEQLRQQGEALRESERREQALAVAQLQIASERQYRNLAEAIPQVVFTTDGAGEVSYFNRRWEELTGRSSVEDRGAGWQGALHADELEGFRAAWSAARDEGELFIHECRLRDRAGEWRWHLCRAVPEERHDQIVRWLGTFTDIGAQKEEEVRAREAVQLRDEFLLIASHELNTPLTSLQLQLQRIRRAVQRSGSIDPALVDSAEVAERSAKRLSKLVQTLLDASRITAGRLRLERESLDLAQAAREVADRLADEAARAGCIIELDAPAPVFGTWDRNRIDQVLSNLVANAIKYGDRKPVELQVRAADGKALLTVRDRGIGISDEAQDRIFQRFQRGVSERHFGGLGLGLYIVSEIVAAHGGTIAVESLEGEGSRFTVELPRG